MKENPIIEVHTKPGELLIELIRRIEALELAKKKADTINRIGSVEAKVQEIIDRMDASLVPVTTSISPSAAEIEKAATDADRRADAREWQRVAVPKHTPADVFRYTEGLMIQRLTDSPTVDLKLKIKAADVGIRCFLMAESYSIGLAISQSCNGYASHVVAVHIACRFVGMVGIIINSESPGSFRPFEITHKIRGKFTPRPEPEL